MLSTLASWIGPLLLSSLAPTAPAAQEAAAPEPEAAPPAPTLALVGGVVHTMVPGAEPGVGTVLLGADRILALGPEVVVPEGVPSVDATGRHVVPGLVDAMVGFDPDHDALYLQAGVTLVRDVGTARVRNLALRDPALRDAAPGPGLLAPGAPLDGDPPSTPEAAILRDASAAEALLPIVLNDGPDYLALLQGLSSEVHAVVLRVANEAGLDVWGPVPAALELPEALARGHSNLTFQDTLLGAGGRWSALEDPDRQALLDRLAAADVRLVPAVEASAIRLVDPTAAPGGLELLRLLASSYEVWWRAEAEARVPLLTEAALARGQAERAAADAFLRDAHAAGVHLVPGSGAPNPWLFPGASLHAELRRWEAAGIPRAEVLDRATRGAAEALGQGEQRGTLEPGKLADLLVVASDPRQDLGALRRPEWVVLRGQALDAATLEAGMQATLEARNAERTLANAPIPVDPPPPSELGRTVLSGSVETWALRQRIRAERFLVERLTDGTTRYQGRIVEPGSASVRGRQLFVRQDVLEGRLQSFELRATDGLNEIVLEGLWTANSWRMRHLVDGVPQGGVNTTRERLVLVDAGSVTSLLLLAQSPREAPFPVLTLHEGLTPEAVRWQAQVDPGGDWQVGTPTGPLAFRLDETGAPQIVRRAYGRGTLDTRLLEAETFGGPGHPLSARARAWVEARAAESAAAADAEAPGAEASGGAAGGSAAGGGAVGDDDAEQGAAGAGQAGDGGR